jgi:D-sedoheptulose 7-phosphate isomerase
VTFETYCQTVARISTALAGLATDIDRAAAMANAALERGNKILLCGNGGSAAQAQHLAAELVGRYLRDRPALPAISLTVDTSAITAIANDFGYETIFSRQLEALALPGDLLIALSTSGNSPNILNALKLAAKKGLPRLGMSNESGGEMARLCDLCLQVPSTSTNHVQEMHLVIGHFLCDQVERRSLEMKSL